MFKFTTMFTPVSRFFPKRRNWLANFNKNGSIWYCGEKEFGQFRWQAREENKIQLKIEFNIHKTVQLSMQIELSSAAISAVVWLVARHSTFIPHAHKSDLFSASFLQTVGRWRVTQYLENNDNRSAMSHRDKKRFAIETIIQLKLIELAESPSIACDEAANWWWNKSSCSIKQLVLQCRGKNVLKA